MDVSRLSKLERVGVNLLVWTLVVPLLTAAIGGLGRPAPFKEAVMVGGLALTFGLCLATASQFLGGAIPAAFGDALARRRAVGAGARALRIRRPAVGRLRHRVSAAQRGARTGDAADAPRVLRPDPGVRVRDAARLGVQQSRHPVDRRRVDDAGVGVPRSRSTIATRRSRRRGSSWCWAASASASRCLGPCCCSRPGKGRSARAWPRSTGRASCRWRRSCIPLRCASASCLR